MATEFAADDEENTEEGPPPKTQEELYEELIVAVKRGRHEAVKYGEVFDSHKHQRYFYV